MYLNSTKLLVADLNKDGKKEIIIVTADDLFSLPIKLAVYQYNGSLLWSRDVGYGHYWLEPIVGDLDGDGLSEIYVEMRENIYGFDYAGNLVFSFYLPGFYDFSKTLTADINSDGRDELITTNFIKKGFNEYVEFLVIANKTSLFKKIEVGSTCGSPGPNVAVGNFDSDKDLEIVLGNTCQSILIYDLDGAVLSGWPKNITGIISGIVTADIDNDGKDEVIISARNISYGGGIYVFSSDGHLLWNKFLDGFFVTSPAIGKLNNGQIVISITNTKEYVYVINALDGSFPTGWPIKLLCSPYCDVQGSNILADINSDGNIDVILRTSGGIQPALVMCGEIITSSGVYAWNIDGSRISLAPLLYDNKLLAEGESDKQVIVDDIDSNGKIDIISGILKTNAISQPVMDIAYRPLPYSISNKCSYPVIDPSGKLRFKGRKTIYVWELEAFYNTSLMSWPQFKHDPQHTGCYDCDKKLKIRPQSKLTNLGTTEVSGKLNILIQRYNQATNATNSWTTLMDKSVISYPVTVKANEGIVKLDATFNPRKISLSQAGKYRVVANFVSNRGTRAESNWEFGVVS